MFWMKCVFHRHVIPTIGSWQSSLPNTAHNLKMFQIFPKWHKFLDFFKFSKFSKSFRGKSKWVPTYFMMDLRYISLVLILHTTSLPGSCRLFKIIASEVSLIFQYFWYLPPGGATVVALIKVGSQTKKIINPQEWYFTLI
jgi:hypothetical protein